jgi:hypothetical protein
MDIEFTPDSDVNIDDILIKIKKYDNFCSADILKNDEYFILNDVTSKILNIPDNVKLYGVIVLDHFNLYLWIEKKNNILLCGLHNTPSKSWYKIKKESDIKILIDFFKSREKVYYNTHRFYLNTQYDFNTLINYYKDSQYILNHIYLDERDESDKIDNDKLTKLDIANIYTLILKSNCNEFYMYSRYSNSKIKFENHNGFIICELNYNHIKLRNRYDPFDKFMPSDVSLLMNQFELKSVSDILNSEEIKIIEIDICVLLAKDKKNLSKLKTKLIEIKKIQNEEISNYIDTVIDRIKSDEIFIQIESDGIFKSFENSVDILIKTVFERFNENKSQDFTYINEILKYKVNNIFYSKLL